MLLAACLAVGQAWAELPDAPQVPCPTGSEVTQRHLLGLWRATFDGLPQGATVLLERHSELADGVRIDATWSGRVIDGSCGLEIRGDRQRSGERTARPFVLRKVP